MSSLNTLLLTFQQLESNIVEANGQIDESVEKTMSELLSQIESKTDKLAFILERSPEAIQFYKNKARTYQQMAKTLENLGERIRDNTRFVMEQTGKETLEGEEYTFKLQAPRTSVEITDPEAIPPDFCKTTYTPIKSIIKPYLENGQEIRGAKLVSKRPITVKPTRKALK